MNRHALDCGLCCGLAECDCGADSVYRVLKPRYSKTGETTQTPDGLIKWYRVDWVDLGVASSYEQARAKFGGRPVLEHIGKIH